MQQYNIKITWADASDHRYSTLVNARASSSRVAINRACESIEMTKHTKRIYAAEIITPREL